MADVKDGKAASWTDTEKLSILFQIIDKGGPIPWNDLVLPEGRTKKAVQIMIGRERSKSRQMLGPNANADGTSPVDSGNESKPAGGKKGKRQADGEAEEAPKKTKTARKKKATTATSELGGEYEVDAEQGNPAVKAEPEEDHS